MTLSTSGVSLAGKDAAPITNAGAARDTWLRRLGGADRLAAGFVVAGAGLRLAQYLGNASQWVDEAMLSTSIVHRDVRGLLFSPLDHGQSAPPGWLLLEKAAISALGSSDRVLRIVPLISSLLTLLICFYLARRVLSERARPLALGLVALAAPLIIYSGQIKQYSSDTCIALGLLLLTLRLQSAVGWGEVLVAAPLGAVAVWCSLPATLVLAALSLLLLGAAWRERTRRSRYSALVTVWMASSLPALLHARSMVSVSMRDVLHSYWSRAFMPLPPRWPTAIRWLIQSITRPFGGQESAGLWYPMNRLYAVLMLIGFWQLARRCPREFSLLVAPVVLTLLAAVVHQYPFFDRLILFLLPTFLFGVAEGIVWVADRLARFYPSAGLPALLALFLPTLYPVLGSLPPYETEDIRPALAYLRDHLQPGDRIYVYHAASPAFEYYSASYGIDPSTYQVGGCHNGDARRYYQELDPLRAARRLWFVVSHDVPLYQDRSSILAYLDALGSRRGEKLTSARVPANSGVWRLTADAYLYEMSDRARQARVAAADFPAPARAPLVANFGCP